MPKYKTGLIGLFLFVPLFYLIVLWSMEPTVFVYGNMTTRVFRNPLLFFIPIVIQTLALCYLLTSSKGEKK